MQAEISPAKAPFRVLRSRTVVLPEADIDTDQIIPARFLATTQRHGLGALAFNDWRRYPDGKERDHILNRVDPRTHRILVAGENFGCGSSREHAPWALVDFGFRAVISSAIADIFRANALNNGLLPVVVASDVHSALLDDSGVTIEIDLEMRRFTHAGRCVTFDVEPFARECLLAGTDSLGWLLDFEPQIAAFERGHGVRTAFSQVGVEGING